MIRSKLINILLKSIFLGNETRVPMWLHLFGGRHSTGECIFRYKHIGNVAYMKYSIPREYRMILNIIRINVKRAARRL